VYDVGFERGVYQDAIYFSRLCNRVNNIVRAKEIDCHRFVFFTKSGRLGTQISENELK
jgi:hypothetical protein